MPGDQGRRLGERSGRAGVADGLVEVAGLLMPGGGPLVQGRHQPRLGGGELQAEQLGEQVVVAIPVAAVVERHQEQVGAFQLLQQPRRAVPLQDGVAQGARQALQDRGAQQERPDGVRLAGQHLRPQVVGDVAVVALEGGDEGARVRPAAERQPGQVEPGRPALGPFGQALHVAGGQPQSHRPVQQGRGLLAGELQVGDPELGQLPTDPHPGQGQRRVGTAGQRHMDPRREVVQEVADAPVEAGLAIRW